MFLEATEEVTDQPPADAHGQVEPGKLLKDVGLPTTVKPDAPVSDKKPAEVTPSEKQEKGDATPKGPTKEYHTTGPLPREWTVLIELAADLDRKTGTGATNKMERLRKLAAETEGKPIAILVQHVAFNEPYVEPADAPGAGALDPGQLDNLFDRPVPFRPMEPRPQGIENQGVIPFRRPAPPFHPEPSIETQGIMPDGLWKEKKLVPLENIQDRNGESQALKSLSHTHDLLSALRQPKNDLRLQFESLAPVQSRQSALMNLLSPKSGEGLSEKIKLADGLTEKVKPAVHLDRYLIANGKIEKLETTPSANASDDLQSFVSTAHKYPASKYALVLMRHGAGNRGIQGDNGTISLADLVGSIRRGLDEPAEKKKVSGKEPTESNPGPNDSDQGDKPVAKGTLKLDLLNFDACQMAEHSVPSAMASVAKHMVASSENEGALVTKEPEMQDLNEQVRALLADPKMTGDTFARKIIEIMRSSSNESEEAYGKWHPVPVLAHFRLEHAEQFKTSLNAFGDTLAGALADSEPLNRKAIGRAIDSTPRLGVTNWFQPTHTDHLNDLKSFAEIIKAACDNGEIKDPDKKIRDSATQLLDARAKLVPDFFGADSGTDALPKYGAQGGIAVFLPDSALRDPKEEAKLQSGPTQLLSVLNGWQKKDPKQLVDAIGTAVTKVIGTKVDEGEDTEKVVSLMMTYLSLLQQTKSEVNTPDRIGLRMQKLEQQANELKELPVFVEDLKKAEASVKSTQMVHTVLSQLNDYNGGWSQFVRKLEKQD